RTLAVALVLAPALAPAMVRAQDPLPDTTRAVTPDTTLAGVPLGPRVPTPLDTAYQAPSARTALIKSLIVPGWGQFSVGAHVRGGIYLAIGATSWAMLGKTIHKLGQAKDQAGAREDFVVDSLRTAMLTDSLLAAELADSAAFDEAVQADSLLADNLSLVDARRQQRQDWIAYTLFFTFLNGLDAYVAAHLTDFPGELDVGRRADGSISIGVNVAIGARRE
ncbi:MAG: DUF5683 domain-containing protein, partial [Longimicrobiales bacterium]